MQPRCAAVFSQPFKSNFGEYDTRARSGSEAEITVSSSVYGPRGWEQSRISITSDRRAAPPILHNHSMDECLL
jgi:hypothetical protein